MKKAKSTILIAACMFVFAGGGWAFADCPSADLTGDCFVDFEDLAVMANQWLTTDPCVPDDMVYIPDGNFVMGDHHGDGYSDELPLHAVLLDSFFMSKYEVTNGQYLNSALGSSIYVSHGRVYGSGNNQPYCDTHSANDLHTQSLYDSLCRLGGCGQVANKKAPVQAGAFFVDYTPTLRLSPPQELHARHILL